MQIDQFESEVEGLQTTGKRKSKPPPKLAHFEESLARHRQHVLRLEQMLRLLDNEGLSVEEVTETRDMVDDYMERNQVLPPRHSHTRRQQSPTYSGSLVRGVCGAQSDARPEVGAAGSAH